MQQRKSINLVVQPTRDGKRKRKSKEWCWDDARETEINSTRYDKFYSRLKLVTLTRALTKSLLSVGDESIETGIPEGRNEMRREEERFD